jgi:hypothetical protein
VKTRLEKLVEALRGRGSRLSSGTAVTRACPAASDYRRRTVGSGEGALQACPGNCCFELQGPR